MNFVPINDCGSLSLVADPNVKALMRHPTSIRSFFRLIVGRYFEIPKYSSTTRVSLLIKNELKPTKLVESFFESNHLRCNKSYFIKSPFEVNKCL